MLIKMFRNNMNWNISNPNPNPASGEPELLPDVGNGYGKCLPKPRNKFTLSSMLINEAFPKCESDDVNINPSTSKTIKSLLRRESSLSNEKRTRHRSLDKLNKISHRSTNRLHDVCNASKACEEMNDRLTQENSQLLEMLKESRKKSLGLKMSSIFALEAFRGQKRLSAELKIATRKKQEEAAARMILHTLLLNSWRNCKAELENLVDDNSQLNKSMENLALQLRVVRHLQGVDKEKMIENNNEIDRMKKEILLLKDDNGKSHEEIEKMESELNSLQANIQNVKEQNMTFECNIEKLVEDRETLKKSLESEKEKATEMEELYESLKEESRKLESKLKEITKQCNHWQENARAFESDTWEMKMNIETKDTKINEIQTICSALKEEKAKIMRMKSCLKEQLDETVDMLEQANFDKTELLNGLDQAKCDIKEYSGRVHDLETLLENAKKECTDIEKELLTYKVQNVKRRRGWANALYFMVNPVDAVRRSLTDHQGQRPYGSVLILRKSL